MDGGVCRDILNSKIFSKDKKSYLISSQTHNLGKIWAFAAKPTQGKAAPKAGALLWRGGATAGIRRGFGVRARSQWMPHAL